MLPFKKELEEEALTIQPLSKEEKRDAYKLAWTYGHKLGLSMLWWQLQGNVKVHGLERALDAVEHGNCMIVWNHVSVPDDFFLNALFYRPWSKRGYLYDERYIIYSMPDRRILDACQMTEERSKRLRCILVDRTDPNVGAKGLITARKILRGGRTISGHLEEGRTYGLSNTDKELIWEGDRCIREISASMLLIANKETTFVPLYCTAPHIDDMPGEWSSSVREPIRRIKGNAGRRYLPVEFNFGETFKLPPDFTYKDGEMREKVRRNIQERILRA